MDKKRNLVADDEPAVLAVSGKMIERLGHEAEMHQEGMKAFESFMADPDRTDLVIADIRMPEISGTALAVRIHEVRPDTPVILCSGDGEFGGLRNDAPGNVRSILSKPFRFKELETAVNRALEPLKSSCRSGCSNGVPLTPVQEESS